MKVGLLADSHDNLPALAKAVGLFNDAETALVIHAGDYVAPFTARAFQELRSDFVGVFGNNDGERFGLLKAFGNKIPPKGTPGGDERSKNVAEMAQILKTVQRDLGISERMFLRWVK